MTWSTSSPAAQVGFGVPPVTPRVDHPVVLGAEAGPQRARPPLLDQHGTGGDQRDHDQHHDHPRHEDLPQTPVELLHGYPLRTGPDTRRTGNVRT